ncbi:MAG: FTR1 family protein [Lachnospiraceae bacterium]|nr:FTR1 family protein [Lachnospiraceae bacterium]
MRGRTKVFGRVFVAVMALLMAVLMVLPQAYHVNAAEVGKWEAAADEIDKYLDAGFEYYLEGNAKDAYNSVNDAYFKIYEVTGFERQTMSYISGPRKNAVELQFSACKGAVKKDNTDVEVQTEVRTEINKLKTMIREDGNKLAAKDGEAASVTKYYDHGELVASDPYADLAGDPDAAVKYSNWTEAAEAVNELLDTAFTAYKGKDYEAALDNYYTALYSVFETSGLGASIYSNLSIEDRESVDAAFEELEEVASGEKFQRKAFQRKTNSVKNLLLADAEKIDTIESEAKAAEEAAAAEAAAAAAASAAEEAGSSNNGYLIFIGAFGIILREGLEAILVIAAILAYLLKSGNKKNVRNVYIGSVLGIVASFLAAWGLTLLKRFAGDAFGAQSQEIIEGITALIAVCVLFYVSNWMISKAEAASWSRYIDGMVQSSVEKSSAFALSFTAFLSVFREGAEVVLFYQPMLTEDGNPGMVWAGFLTGCVVLVGVYFAIRFLSIKLPIKPFFTATSILMAYMSVSFLGSGIKELAEGGLLDVTRIPWMLEENDVLDVLGIYPYVEMVIPQLILIIILVATFVAARYKGKIDAMKAETAKAAGQPATVK